MGIYGSLRKLEAFLLESQALLRDCASPLRLMGLFGENSGFF